MVWPSVGRMIQLLVRTYQTTRCHTTEDHSMNLQRCDDLICMREAVRPELSSNAPARCRKGTRCKADESSRNRKSTREVQAGALSAEKVMKMETYGERNRKMTIKEGKISQRLSLARSLISVCNN